MGGEVSRSGEQVCSTAATTLAMTGESFAVTGPVFAATEESPGVLEKTSSAAGHGSAMVEQGLAEATRAGAAGQAEAPRRGEGGAEGASARLPALRVRLFSSGFIARPILECAKNVGNQ